MRNSYTALVSIILATNGASGSPVVGPITNPANGHDYYLLEASTWTAAEAEAVSMGGHLVTINDAAEDDWIYTTELGSAAHRWIGFTDAGHEGNWVWVSGEQVTYTNWYPFAPSGAGDYAEWDHISWNDVGNDGFGVPHQGIVEVVPEGGASVIEVEPFGGEFSEGFETLPHRVHRQEWDVFNGNAIVKSIGSGSGLYTAEFVGALPGGETWPRTGEVFLFPNGVNAEWVFDTSAEAFGGYFTTLNSTNTIADGVARFFDINDNLIGEHTVTAPKGNQWVWNGWTSDIPIKRVEIIGNSTQRTGYVMHDDMEYTPSPDCNDNMIPDSCDLDCGNAGGGCDLPGCGDASDCDANGLPDECDPDCNENGVPDECDISALGTPFVHNFDMHGDYTEYRQSATNVYVDVYPPVTYWCPSQPGVWGEVIYGYELPFEIAEASIFASLINYRMFDPQCTAYLDVSPDGVNWTNVAEGDDPDPYPLGSWPVIDLSDILEGSATAYIRARLYEGSPFPWGNAQFLRTGTSGFNTAPKVYEFYAVPGEHDPDCNDNTIPDECDIANCDGLPWCSDCNENDIPDDCDIMDGTSQDCNENGVPDECDLFVCDDGNVCTVDTCDPVLGCTSDGAGVSAACDDGNACTTNDVCQGNAAGTCAGTLADADGDGVCDAEDTCPGGDDNIDCQPNGVPDYCDIEDGTSQDCNSNDIPDECDLILGASFFDTSSWATYDPGDNGVGIDPDGYKGAAFDGQYVYFVPYHNGEEYHGEVLRYDTTSDFALTSSWATYNPGANGVGNDPVGYNRAVYDGQYVYFVPNRRSTGRHGEVLRYDTSEEFTLASSWITFDPGSNGVGNDPDGLVGAAFDGRYIYFSPAHNGTQRTGEVLRYDTDGAFSDVSSWTTYDAGAHGVGNDPDGYWGAIFDGHYVYFVPIHNGTNFHGEVMRYDTDGAFSEASSWVTFNPGDNGVGNYSVGYAGAVSDGRYIYFVPFNTLFGPGGYGFHGEVLRFDTSGDFSDVSSWAAFDAGDNGVGTDPDGYKGAVFDGRFIYFVPRENEQDEINRNGEVLRYDTVGAFSEASSWATFDAGDNGVGNDPDGFNGAVFDGRYIFFVPIDNGTDRHGEVLRYDTTGARSHDCNENDIPDECDLIDGTSQDCNSNGVPDECDIIDGTSQDCNANDIPDDCEPDTDGDGIIEDCDDDDDNDGVPDGGDPAPLDPDMCGDSDDDGCDDCAIGTDDFGPLPDNNPSNDGPDADTDGICDVGDNCDLYNPDQFDCQQNNVGDVCDIASCDGDPTCADCQENGVPDGCDIDPVDPDGNGEVSEDSNGNGVPDECVQPPVPPSLPHGVRKNRYISFDPNNTEPAALQVRLSSMRRCSGDLSRTCRGDSDCPRVCDNDNTIQCVDAGTCGGSECVPTAPCVEHPDVGSILGWVAEPFNVAESCDPLPCDDTDWIARVDPDPVYRIWTENLLHVGDCEIIPVATYSLRATADGITFTDSLVIGTIRKPESRHYGDVAGAVDSVTGQYTPPDGFVNVVDVQVHLHTVQNYPVGSPYVHRTWVDLHGLDPGTAPNYIINVSDLQRTIFAFEGRTYTQTPDQLDPGDCP